MALLQTDTAEGALKGMILGRAPHQLEDQEVAYLQDALVNQAGYVSRRGAVTGATSLGNNFVSQRPGAVCSTYDPQGVFRIMVVHWAPGHITGVNYSLWGSIYDSNLTFISRQPLTEEITGLVTPGLWIHTSACLDGSVVISGGTGYGAKAKVIMSKWHGGAPTIAIAYGATVALTPTPAQKNATSFTGSVADIAKLKTGMILHGIGCIKSIDSTTQLTCTGPTQNVGTVAFNSLYGVACAFGTAQGRGKITVSGTTVVGYGTKFLAEPTGLSPSLQIFDPLDNKLIAYGYAGAGATDTVIPGVTVVKAVTMSDYLLVDFTAQFYPYIWMLPVGSGNEDSRTFGSAMGHFLASWKGYQFSFASTAQGLQPDAPTQRCYIGGPSRPERMDHAADGDFFDVVSTVLNDPDGIAIQGGRDSLVLCKGKETFALRGDDPTNFAIDKIGDDGALSCNAITRYGGGVIWVGQKGIWYFDGTSAPVNLVADSMADRWQQLTAGYSTNSTATDADGYPLNQCHVFVHRDHLFVNITNTNSQHTVYTDGVARTQQTCQLAIYLPTNALSFLTNFNFIGYISGWGTAQNNGYTLLCQKGSTTHYLFPVDNLFTQGVATIDTLLGVNQYDSGTLSTSVGPWFHMESRKYSAGDGLRRKVWKQLSIESKLTSTKRLYLETVPGLNTTGTRQTTPYVGTGLFLAFKNKFNARDQYMSFRLYEDILNRPATMVLGAWQWAFKQARKGQV